MTASDQESSSDIVLRLVGLYREVAQAAAETYQHVKQAADLFELDPVHPEGFAALSKARAWRNASRPSAVVEHFGDCTLLHTLPGSAARNAGLHQLGGALDRRSASNLRSATWPG
jgi:hypothetical protein